MKNATSENVLPAKASKPTSKAKRGTKLCGFHLDDETQLIVEDIVDYLVAVDGASDNSVAARKAFRAFSRNHLPDYWNGPYYVGKRA